MNVIVIVNVNRDRDRHRDRDSDRHRDLDFDLDLDLNETSKSRRRLSKFRSWYVLALFSFVSSDVRNRDCNVEGEMQFGIWE